MKDILQVYLFWIILVVVMLGIAGSYFVIVMPKISESANVTAEIEKDKKSLEKYLKKTLYNRKCHDAARAHVEELKAEEELCVNYLEKYKYFWDKPLREVDMPEFDADVFKAVYDTEKKKFLQRARALINLNGNPFNWPDAEQSAEEETAIGIHRFFWVQSEFLDVIVKGKADRLEALSLPRQIRGESDEGTHQTVSFEVTVSIVYADIPNFIQSLLSLDNKFLCYIDGLKISKGGGLPTLVPGKPLREPSVILTVKGRIYLFHKPDPAAEEDEEEEAGLFKPEPALTAGLPAGI
ncbi:MAG: hypothetical protein QF473_34830 [Planctomycetota bacterium]|jgi:hypothetical protein|nr:hypothetical protein [Planctomycetota bacterium]